MGRTVLMIARAYPPLTAAGAHRPVKLAKYLPEVGWKPVVLCAEWTPENAGNMYDPILAVRPDVCRTVRVPYPAWPSGMPGKALAKAARVLWPYHTPLRFMRRLQAQAEGVLADTPVDALWSTYSPGLTHVVAGRLSGRRGIPWVADFRDIPDQVRDSLSARWTIRWEVKTCRAAKAIVTVDSSLAARLASRHAQPVHIIPNGFDPDDYPPPEPGPIEQFTISYFGTVSSNQSAGPLFAALDRLSEQAGIDPQDVRVRFYGTIPGPVLSRVNGFRCRNLVEYHPRVPQEEMVRLQQRSAVLLLLGVKTSGGIMPRKAFDYLGAQRPILDIPGGGVTSALLGDTGAGVSAAEPAQIADILARWYREWKRTGTVAYTGDPAKITRYSCRERARELADVLDSVAGRR